MLRGILKTWNDDKGYGFIRQDSQSRDIFLHISALRGASRRPVVGDTLLFQLAAEDPDRPRAVNAVIEGVAVTPQPADRWTLAPQAAAPKPRKPPRLAAARTGRTAVRPASRGRQSRGGRGLFALAGFAAMAGYLAYTGLESPPLPQVPAPVVEAPAAPAFRCEGKTRCTQMVSCEEALFYLRNCPGTITDGDGIPCEDQHCNH